MKNVGDAGSVVEAFHNAKTEKISSKPIVFLSGGSFSALLFAFWHLPVHFNLAQLIYSFVTGALFAVLRVEFGEKAGLLATTAAHWIANVF